MTTETKEYRCSFCGRRQDEVHKLVAGPKDVYICNLCAHLVTEIHEEEQESRAKGRPAGPMRRLTHVDEQGRARMVDVGAKPATERRAVARGLLRLSTGTIKLVRDGKTPKGDVLGTARLAGIMAAKRTSELIPLTHPLPLSHVAVDLEIIDDGISIEATAATTAPTGVEMEALTAVAVAGLTLYDMLKSVERSARLTDVRLVEKSGGRSGHLRLE